MNQKQQILDYLKEGNSLTWLDAVRLFGSSRLGARVWDLKQDGWDIESEMVEINGKHVAKYTLNQPAQQSLFGEVQ